MEVTRDALLLDGWVTVGIKQVGRDREITARYTKQADACPKCKATSNIHKHGSIETGYVDAPGWGGSVRIVAKLQRYLCHECHSSFIQPITGMDADRRMTQRGIEYIQRRCLEPGARTPRQTTYDWPQCMNCLAEYPPSQMTVDSLPFPEGHVRQMALLCPECLGRFHG